MKKRYRVFLLSLLLVIILSVAVSARVVDITILHTNDTHSRLEEGKYDGMGFAKIATLVADEQTKNQNLLLLDAGDTFHGLIISTLVEGESVIRLFNKLGYDAMVPGNHDFNYGQARLLELNQMTDFPIIAANIKKEYDTPFLDAYIIKEIDGVKVAIFGLATPETTYKTHPKNVEGLVFENPVEAARIMVEELKGKTDVIIALSHLGLDDSSEYTSEMVANQVTGIDLIIDGHSHTVLQEGKTVGDTLITMAGEYDKYLGVINLTVEDGKATTKKAHLISKEDAADVRENKEVLQLITDIKNKNNKITSVIVGETEVTLDGERAHVRTGDTNLGNLITDAILEAVDADLSITNGGGIRASIAKGKITRGDIITVLPFGNYVVVKEVTGSAILNALEHGITAYPEVEGKFPHVGGMTVVFDSTRPAGERVLKVMVSGQPLEYDKTYRLATNDFMAAGGDGYEMFKDAPIVQEAGGLDEITAEYIKKRGSVKPVIEYRVLPVDEQGYYSYSIKQGDSLSKIAAFFGVTVTELAEINQIVDNDMIFIGEEILISVIE